MPNLPDMRDMRENTQDSINYLKCVKRPGMRDIKAMHVGPVGMARNFDRCGL